MPGYSATNPLDASPALSIDPQTGLLTGTPTTEGQYVVGVCVREYRNGVLIATHIRDFQFNVSECIPVVVASLPDQIISCDDLEISVGNNSLGAIEYFWDFGDPTTTSDTTSAEFPPNYIYPDTGTYTITLIANPGAPCADTATALVTAYPNLTPGFSVVAGCAGQPVVFTDSSVTTFGVLDEWLWNFGDGQTGTAQNPEHQYGAGGNYTATLVVTTDKGCIDTISKSFTVMDGPNADFTADDVCEGEEVFFDDLSVVPVGIIVDYDWDLGDGTVSADTEPTHTYNSTGSYDVTLILLSDNDCNDTITRTVVVGEVPTVDAGPDETIEFGQSTTLNGTSSGTTYSWIPPETLSDPNSPNPTAEPTETTTYYLTVTSDDNCAALDSVTIYVDPLSILNVPNAFSPNNDGTNDILEIHHNDIQELIYFRIYNRWGQMIYETSDLMAGWDGTYKGKEQEVATYVYVAKATGLDGTDFLLKGNVTLLR